MTAKPPVHSWWRCPIHKGLWAPGKLCTLCVAELEREKREAEDRAVAVEERAE